MGSRQRRRADLVMDRLVHDFHNALAPVRNAVQLMARDDADLGTMAYAREMIDKQIGELERIAKEIEVASREVAAPVARAAHKSRRVLIIDDNRNWVDSLAAILIAEGYEVDVAYGGQEGVEAALRNPPDVVLLDIEMPEVSGYEAARRLRTRLGKRCPQIVAISVWGQDSARAAGRQAGFNHHLTKPVAFTELEKILAS
jgi:two-component system CheB/CheR fusion protein